MLSIALFRDRNLLTAVLFLVSAIAFTGAMTRYDVKQLGAAETQALAVAGGVVIDVRDHAVSGSAHLPGALLIPLDTLLAQVEARGIAKTTPVVVYCGEGSSLGPRAAHILTQAGYSDVANLKGGIAGWRAAGLPVAKS